MLDQTKCGDIRLYGLIQQLLIYSFSIVCKSKRQIVHSSRISNFSIIIFKINVIHMTCIKDRIPNSPSIGCYIYSRLSALSYSVHMKFGCMNQTLIRFYMLYSGVTTQMLLYEWRPRSRWWWRRWRWLLEDVAERTTTTKCDVVMTIVWWSSAQSGFLMLAFALFCILRIVVMNTQEIKYEPGIMFELSNDLLRARKHGKSDKTAKWIPNAIRFDVRITYKITYV